MNLAIGALLLLGVGVVVWRVVRPAPGLAGATPALLPPATPPQGSGQPAANTGPQQVAAYWSKASLVLNGLPDPHDHAVADAGNQHVDSGVGTTMTVIKTAIGLIPVVGQIGLALWAALDALGPLIVGKSKGGYDNLPKLTKLRAVVYSTQPPVPSKWQLQLDELGAPAARPQRAGNNAAGDYTAAYRKWVRATLKATRWDAEFRRFVATSDEAMLPAVLINALLKNGYWPPPLQPFPIEVGAFTARYPPGHPSHSYVPDPHGPYAQLVLYTDSKATQDADRQLATAAYQELVAEYQADAVTFVREGSTAGAGL